MFAKAPASGWEADLTEAGIGCVEVAPAPPEGNYLGQFGRSQGYVSEVEHPVFGTHPRMAPMVRFSRSATISKPGSVLGQHTAAVLAEIGLGEDRVAALREAGVLLTA